MRLEHPPRWRRLLKEVVASAMCRACGHQLPAPLAGQQNALVIGYHRVVEDFEEASEADMPTMLVSRSMFERHLDWIGRRFRFVDLDDIGAHVESGRPFDRPVAAVTFDDGYRDFYEHAFPILKQRGIPAAVFVVTDTVGQPSCQIHDRLYHLMDKAYASWDNPRRRLSSLLAEADVGAGDIAGIRAASRNPYSAVSTLLPALSQTVVERIIDLLGTEFTNGNVKVSQSLTWPMIAALRRGGCTIGSHTRTHAWLANESEEKSLDELAGSKRELESRLGEPVLHFAYPGGQFTPRVVETVERAGYRFAYTACDHHDSRHPSLTIQRLLLWERSSVGADGDFSADILHCQTHGLWPPSRKCERAHTA